MKLLEKYRLCVQCLHILLDTIEQGSEIYRLKNEDGVEIRKLYLKLVDTSLTSNDVRFLLSVYGNIESIDIFGEIACKKRRKMRNRGFITFSNCFEATAALINRKKLMNVLNLSPADTWLQPDYLKKEDFGKSLEEIDDFMDSDLLQKLNDDCLLHIMTHLDVLDVLNLQKVCRKFEELSKIHLRSIRSVDFAKVKGKKKITLHESRMIFRSIGKPVYAVSVNSEKFNGRRVLNFIPKYFRDLQFLKLKGFKLDSEVFWKQMGKITSNLHSLDLSDNSEIHENFLGKVDSKSRKLISLSVANSNINGSFISTLPLVRELNVSGCRFVNGRQLIEFISRNEHLISLNIAKCPNVYGQELNELLQKFKCCETLALNNYYVDEITSRFIIPNINKLDRMRNLTICNVNFPPSDQLLRTINFDHNRIERLNISYGSLSLTSVYALSTMKHLRSLTMNFKNNVPDDLVDYLIELRCFEELRISGSSHVSPTNTLRLFSMENFRCLDVSRCYGYTNNFVIQVMEVVRNRKANFITELVVGQTEIDIDVTHSNGMENYRKYLLLNWDAAKNLEHDYDIDEENKYSRRESIADQENLTVDDIINILSSIDECDEKMVESIKKFL